jgi:hypothetical protein
MRTCVSGGPTQRHREGTEREFTSSVNFELRIDKVGLDKVGDKFKPAEADSLSVSLWLASSHLNSKNLTIL